MDRTSHKFIVKVKEEMAIVAEDSCLHPVSDPFVHGVQVGRYQGLKDALDILDALYREELDKE